jgi:aldehyde:ferredoxin oxidoreductase
MDLYERGILTKKDTDSLELKWGNREAIIKCVHKIATREGFGDLLAEGPYIMAQKIGGKAPSLVMHFKKMCPTSNEVRPMKGLALGYATSTVGATHLRGVNRAEGGAATREQVMELFGTEDMMNPTLYDTVGKPKGVQYYQRLAAICDCLEICKFNTFWTSYPTYIKQLARLFNLVTGVESNENQFEEIADRVYLLEKAFNTREGYTWKDDLPCERMQNEPISDGKHKGEVLNRESFIEMLKAYYKITGCDIETGIPTYQTLSKLGLSEVADQLVALGKIENNQ